MLGYCPVIQGGLICIFEPPSNLCAVALITKVYATSLTDHLISHLYARDRDLRH
jgi:hypothetical protein